MTGRLLPVLLATVFLILPGSARGADVEPTGVSLTAQPVSVSWPGSPATTIKAAIESGPGGADFRFYFEPDGWGLDGVSGNPFLVDQAVLEGQGSLILQEAVVTDLMSTACFRGGFQSVLQFYRLTLPANSATVLSASVRATSSRLGGMTNGVSLVIPKFDGDLIRRTEIPIGGPEGVRVSFGVQGQSGKSNLETGKTFRLSGGTFPPLPNTQIRLVASPRAHGFHGLTSAAHQLTTVTTNGQGRFLSEPVKLNTAATWVLLANPVTGPAHHDETSCGPVVETKGNGKPPESGKRRLMVPTVKWLLGKYFRSIRVIGGPSLKGRILRLGFEKRKRPVLGISGACNNWDRRFRIRRGRLFIFGRGFSTATACHPVDPDAMLRNWLRKGMVIRRNGNRLILTRPAERVRIVLRRVR